MRPAPPLLILLLAAAVFAGSGCSKQQDKLFANRRLLRGEGGLGTTTSLILTPDRDTYAGTAKSILDSPALVGTDGPLEARAFFTSSIWLLPPSTVPSDSIIGIEVQIAVDSLSDRPIVSSIVAMSENAGAFDSSKVWGDPSGAQPGLTLAQADVNDPGPLKFVLPPAKYADIQRWAARPDSFQGLAFVGTSSNALILLDANAALMRIIYLNRATAVDNPDTTNTPLRRHYALRSPLAPAPTGSDTTLVLGGNFDTGLLLRFPPLSVPEGSTVNEATLRLRLDPATTPFATGDEVEIVALGIKSYWDESLTQRDSLTFDLTTLGIRSKVAVSAGDSVISVALPPRIIREWSGPLAVNNGVLIQIRKPYYTPPILVRSRESSLPVELRVSYTGPPPARF
ncbi:MAG TPA: hypothetical protein VFS09_03975 [Candidatus Eisenbacteria bacterium]|nr:hypothetical protein [Candidatus Eisenbacteria bacterium]